MIIISTGWDYSDLSREAKLKGGPEKFVEYIHKEGFIKGSVSSLLATGTLIGCYCLFKKSRCIKSKKEMVAEEIDEKGLEEIKQLMDNELEAEL